MLRFSRFCMEGSPNQTDSTTPVAAPVAAPVDAPVAARASVGLAGIPVKKRRGRPRKYGPKGTVALPLSVTPISSSMPPVSSLTPPVSSSAPPVSSYSPVTSSGGDASAAKRGRGRPRGSMNKPKPKVDMENLGIHWVQSSTGRNFTSHIISVADGEDITLKVISFSQQGSRAVCILSANGLVSNVTLLQPNSAGGTLTYEILESSFNSSFRSEACTDPQIFIDEGPLELLSLSGSFMPTESGGTRSLSGGMSVSLSNPDGLVIGGGIAGVLIASGLVQVVVGSFVTETFKERKPKKSRAESASAVSPTAPISLRREDSDDSYDVHGKENSITRNSNLDPSIP